MWTKRVQATASRILPAQVRSWEHRNWSNDALGTSFGPRATRKKIMNYLLQLHESGDLGRLILDLGASRKTVSFAFSSQKGHVVIGVDAGIGKKPLDYTTCIYSPTLIVPGDVQDIPAALQHEQVAVLLAKCGITQPPLFDAIILSDILNYVDFRLVLDSAVGYAKPGALLVINNMAGVVAEIGLASPRGVKSNQELVQYLRRIGLEIVEYQKSLWDCTDNVDTSERDLILCRKPLHPANVFDRSMRFLRDRLRLD
jgi:hypothetical protein